MPIDAILIFSLFRELRPNGWSDRNGRGTDGSFFLLTFCPVLVNEEQNIELNMTTFLHR